jgi:hypothetical protein
MNIYVSHPGSYDYENGLYKPIKESELSQAHNFFLPHEPENIDTDAKVELKTTDVLVAESSMPSNSLRFVTGKIIEYSDIDDLFAKLQAILDRLPVRDN